MTTQYTPILKLALPVTGELSGTWGDVVNDNITSMVEQAVAGLATINTWTANSHALTTANGTTSESRCAMLVAADGAGGTALTAAGEIVCPAASKLYVLKNGSSYAVTLKTSAGSGVAVPSGDTAFLFCDGTNVNACVTTIVNGHISGNLTVDGNTTLGNAATDTITATAQFNTDLLPSTDNARDLGSTAKSWRTLYCDTSVLTPLVTATNLQVTNIKANDGTAAMSIADSTGAITVSTLLNVDNLRLDGNTLSSTDSNGNIVLAPNGNGQVQITSAALDLTTIEVTNIKANDGTASIVLTDSTGAVDMSKAVTMSATTQNIDLGTSQTSGTFTVGGAAQTGAQTFDQSTKTHTLNIGTGATENAATKTVNLATAGVSGSTTTMSVGSAVSGAITNLTVNATTTLAPIARSTGAVSYFTVTTPADTGLTASTEVIGSSFSAATRTWATGALTLQRERVFAAPTYAFAGASTLTTAVNVDIGLPVAGTNATITNAYALRADNTLFTGNVVLNNASAALDLTNLEVTNIKAKDGTAAMTLADSTGVVSITAAPVLTALTPSQAVFTDASKGLVSNAITGTGNVVMSTSPTLVTPNLGTPSALVGTNITGTAAGLTAGNVTTNANLTGAVTSVGNATSLGSFTSAQLAGALTDETGSGSAVFATSPTLVTPVLGTPTSVTLTNATGLPISTGVSGLGTGVATFLATPSSANLAAAVTDETGSGALVFATSPTLVTPALGTPSSGVVTNLTGTASININGTVGATTANTGAFTTLSSTGNTTLGDASADTVTINGTVQPGVVISGSSSSNALRITQTGTGNALLVEDAANPDSSPFVIDTTGAILRGTTTTINVTSELDGTQASVGITNASVNNSAALALLNYTNTTTNARPAYMVLGRSNGAPTTQTTVEQTNELGLISFQGSDGTNFVRAASIKATVDGTPGTNDMPGRLVLSTTADGASTPTERVRINSSGLTTVGFSAVTGAALSTTVAAKLYSSSTTYTDGITAASGTVVHGTITSFDNPAIAATNATVTYTNASTVYIDGAPTAGSNVTITNPYALYVAAGGVFFGGAVSAADPIVQQSDIGTAPNEVPLNQYLGAMAFEDTETPALDVGTGITTGTGTICKANGGLMGGIFQMSILIDLTGLNSGGTAGDIIGVNGTALPCYIALIPAMTVLGGRMTCLETPAGGDTDIDLYSATEGTGVEDQAITALTETQIINAGAQTVGTMTYFSADPAANAYFYLVGQGTANATYTAGRFLIEIFGVQ